jgi:hypothetical protein
MIRKSKSCDGEFYVRQKFSVGFANVDNKILFVKFTLNPLFEISFKRNAQIVQRRARRLDRGRQFGQLSVNPTAASSNLFYQIWDSAISAVRAREDLPSFDQFR